MSKSDSQFSAVLNIMRFLFSLCSAVALVAILFTFREAVNDNRRMIESTADRLATVQETTEALHESTEAAAANLKAVDKTLTALAGRIEGVKSDTAAALATVKASNLALFGELPPPFIPPASAK